MSGEVRESSKQQGCRRQHRRRRHRSGAARKLLQPQAESVSEFPGFFALPRSSPRPGPESTATKLRRWKWQLKMTAMLVLVIGGFMGTLVYFFVAVSSRMSPPLEELSPRADDGGNPATNIGFTPNWR
jgi:hypothetical protein